ncbi:hypothetical protein [Collinsella tanakaei]|uniref:hypothetical protein n=1 Tax=Collinsella tanakaei TaxID=626935 RepID=UPI0022E1B86C|nr:hypothetical protein [Collinsella tanakaei]
MAYTDIEQRILDMWPKFEDGSYMWFGDKAVANSGRNEGKEFTVGQVYFENEHDKLLGSVPDGCYWNYKAADPYVKRPAPKVLDADGVEVKVDDTVWLKDGTELLVEEVNRYGARCFDGEIRMTLDPKSLTHTQPDSWECLERDADNGSCGYFGFQGKECTGCPAFGSDKPCTSVVCTDIVRRAKALAEKEAAR